jgi:hypothetical protein
LAGKPDVERDEASLLRAFDDNRNAIYAAEAPAVPLTLAKNPCGNRRRRPGFPIAAPSRSDTLHRLEAAKALGEKTIVGFLVDARKH